MERPAQVRIPVLLQSKWASRVLNWGSVSSLHMKRHGVLHGLGIRDVARHYHILQHPQHVLKYCRTSGQGTFLDNFLISAIWMDMSFVLATIESNLRSLTEAFPLKLCVQHHGDM